MDQHELLSLWSIHFNTIKSTQVFQDDHKGTREQMQIITYIEAYNALTGYCKESTDDEFC